MVINQSQRYTIFSNPNQNSTKNRANPNQLSLIFVSNPNQLIAKPVSNPKQLAKRMTFSTHQTTHSIQLSGVITAVSFTSYALRNDDGN